GAVFEIKLVNGEYSFTTTSATTDQDGFLSFTDLKPGKYKITETEAPEGYIKLPKPIEVEITHENAGKAINLTNEEQNDTLAKITLEKTDSESKVFLSGAEFELSKDDMPITDHPDMTNGKFVTKNNGKFEITGLAGGTYTL